MHNANRPDEISGLFLKEKTMYNMLYIYGKTVTSLRLYPLRCYITYYNTPIIDYKFLRFFFCNKKKVACLTQTA